MILRSIKAVIDVTIDWSHVIVRLFGLDVTETRNIRLTRRTGNWLVCYYRDHNTHVPVLPWARAEQVGVAE